MSTHDSAVPRQMHACNASYGLCGTVTLALPACIPSLIASIAELIAPRG